VDATLQAAQNLGARVVVGATDIPDAGRFAVLADPQGAAFALYGAPANAPASGGGSSGPDAFSWHELATSDPVAALRFYSELFGWTEDGKHDMGAPMGVYHLVAIQGVQSVGIFTSPPDRPLPAQWMCYAHVTDVDKSANAAKASGGKLANGPMEVPGGTWIAHLVDPQGAVFAVHADKRVAAAAPAAQPAKVAAPKSPAAPAAAAKPSPPTLKAPASASAGTASTTAATATPTKPKPAPTVSAPTVTAASTKPAAAKPAPAPAAKPAAKKAPAKAVAKKAAKKKAPAKKAAKKAKKKASAKKRPQRKSKSVAKRAPHKSAKRKALKKRAKKSSRRRTPAGGFAVAKRFAVKQADSLLKRLRGKKHR
jgi:predicted enzyme related to lactoylglutathione lyase